LPFEHKVNEGVTQAQAKEREVNYFKNHPYFSKLQSSLFGTANLVNALTRVLVSNIKIALPEIHEQLEIQLEQASEELKSLGRAVPTDEREQQALVMHKVC
jgi:hypothetical protein